MTRAARIIEFIERYCVTPEGASVGTPLVLAEFQKQCLRDVYDNPHGTRRAILSIARKNGKSGLIAGLLLAHLPGVPGQPGGHGQGQHQRGGCKHAPARTAGGGGRNVCHV